jgi:Protein of unknown function (DUF2442)
MKRGLKGKRLLPAVNVERARGVGRYVLEIVFSDGTTKRVDFEPFLRSSGIPEASTFLDETKFRRFKVLGGNLIWGDFAMLFPVSQLHAGEIALSGQVVTARSGSSVRRSASR